MSTEPAPAARPEAGEVAPAATDWLRNTLTVHGPSAAMAAFREAAAGSGVIPWQLDLERLEEDWFLPMAGPADGVRAISLAGARILARRLREATAARHDRSLERLARGDRGCPLDLHGLLPVPPAVLQLGPDDPASRVWLWTHWGTTRALRHVRALPARLDGRRKRADALAVEYLVGRLVALARRGPAASRLARARLPSRARLRGWLSGPHPGRGGTRRPC